MTTSDSDHELPDLIGSSSDTGMPGLICSSSDPDSDDELYHPSSVTTVKRPASPDGKDRFFSLKRTLGEWSGKTAQYRLRWVGQAEVVKCLRTVGARRVKSGESSACV